MCRLKRHNRSPRMPCQACAAAACAPLDRASMKRTAFLLSWTAAATPKQPPPSSPSRSMCNRCASSSSPPIRCPRFSQRRRLQAGEQGFRCDARDFDVCLTCCKAVTATAPLIPWGKSPQLFSLLRPLPHPSTLPPCLQRSKRASNSGSRKQQQIRAREINWTWFTLTKSFEAYEYGCGRMRLNLGYRRRLT